MDVDSKLFKNIMAEARNNSDLLDSFSPNQFASKEKLISSVNNLNILDADSEVVILGGWYGSILIPAFKQVKRITLIDIDTNAVSVAKNRLFNHYTNVDFITSDVFDKDRHGRIMNADVIINTSCEHMKSMKHLEALAHSEAYFAFTSNNMHDIEGHTNTVNNLEEFIQQLPSNAKVLHQDEIEDSRGTRYLLTGKLST
jgi:hypothetical protein|tara:strand:- start:2510 stop:3106 length:597 start_codon:yes stop_codon:yes gene_type:complete